MVSKTIILGRVGKDPEVRNLDNGTAVANFSMATTESWKDKATGEKKEQTEWHNIVIWGKTAEIAQKYVHKGDLLYVEGKNRTRLWEKDGVTRYTTEVLVDKLSLLSSNSSQGSSENSNDPQTDDLPF
jgi:single-strand DNA-binding protein